MTTTTAIAYDCPDWCARTDHDADDLNGGDAPFHYAPEFGVVIVQAKGDGPFEIRVLEHEIRDIAGLQDHAQDVINAASWLIEHRQ